MDEVSQIGFIACLALSVGVVAFLFAKVVSNDAISKIAELSDEIEKLKEQIRQLEINQGINKNTPW